MIYSYRSFVHIVAWPWCFFKQGQGAMVPSSTSTCVMRMQKGLLWLARGCHVFVRSMVTPRIKLQTNHSGFGQRCGWLRHSESILLHFHRWRGDSHWRRRVDFWLSPLLLLLRRRKHAPGSPLSDGMWVNGFSARPRHEARRSLLLDLQWSNIWVIVLVFHCYRRRDATGLLPNRTAFAQWFTRVSSFSDGVKCQNG